MRSNQIHRALGYSIMSPLFVHRYLVGALYECVAIPEQRNGNNKTVNDQYPFLAKDIEARALVLFYFSIDNGPE